MSVLLEFEHTRYGGITGGRVFGALVGSQLSKLIGDGRSEIGDDGVDPVIVVLSDLVCNGRLWRPVLDRFMALGVRLAGRVGLGKRAL